MQEFVGKTVIRKVAVKDLLIHPRAQRAVISSKIRQLEKNMDLNAIGTFHACEYAINGIMAIWNIDGQHRQIAMMKCGLGECLVDVMVHVDVNSDQDAAKLFLLLNDRMAVGSFDKFINHLYSCDKVAIGMNAVIETCGLKMGRGNGARVIKSVDCVRRAYILDGGSSLSVALNLIDAAWGSKDPALEGKLIEGLSIFIANHSSTKIDISGFAKRLAKLMPGEIIARATINAKSLRQIIANQFVFDFTQIYNTGRSSGQLSMDQKRPPAVSINVTNFGLVAK